jgi:hypothetical protein
MMVVEKDVRAAVTVAHDVVDGFGYWIRSLRGMNGRVAHGRWLGQYFNVTLTFASPANV